MDRYSKKKMRLGGTNDYGTSSTTEIHSSERYSRLGDEFSRRSYDSGHQSQATVTSMDRSSLSHHHPLDNTISSPSSLSLSNSHSNLPSSSSTGNAVVNIQRSLLFTDDIIRRERSAKSAQKYGNQERNSGNVVDEHGLRGVINPAFEHCTTSPTPLNFGNSRNFSNVSISTLNSNSSSPVEAARREGKNDQILPTIHSFTNQNYDFSHSSSDLSSNMSMLESRQQSGGDNGGKCGKYLTHLKQCITPDFDDDDNSYQNNHHHDRDPSCCFIFWRLMTSLIPILGWLPKYNFRHDAISDLLTGCTIVALHIPQGLAYSQLAGLAPVNGLYVSLFPVVVYAILGGSRQLSVGTFAVVCITCKDVLTSLSHEVNIIDFEKHDGNLTSGSNSTMASMESYTSVEVLSSLALMVGVILLVMGVLRLGVLATLLSEPIISAFVVASSLYVLTSQIFDLIGIKSKYGEAVIPFELLDNWYQFCVHVDKANLHTIGLSALTIACLLTSKKLIEPFIQKRFDLKHFALPAELLAIIVVTFLSSIFKFHDNYNIVVIPKLDAGFGHMPVTPSVRLWSNGAMITGAFVIAFIVYATSFTLAKLFADNHNYRVNANQELLALGSANIVGSFFLCFPASGSLARSAVQEKVGGKTQLASLYSAGFLVLFLLFLSGYLATLPKSTLASIILVALLNTLKKFNDVRRFWNISRLEGCLWLVTFVLVVLFGVGNGLLYALAFNLVVLIIRMAIPRFSVRRPILDSECYYSYSGEFEIDDISHGTVVFEFHGSLMHLSVEHFRRQFRTKILQVIRKQKTLPVKFVIFDSHAVSYIDGKGVEILRETRETLRQLGNIQFLLAGCNGGVHDTLQKCGYFGQNEKRLLFATVIDAVYWAKLQQDSSL